MKALLKTLCSLDGAPGDEAPVRSFLCDQVKPFTDSIEIDAMGNLIVFKKGAKTPSRRLLLSAHMDEVALMVKSISDDGYLKFVTLGGIDRRILVGKRVRVGAQRIPGVIGLKAYHLSSPEERTKIPNISDLFIDIGTNTKEASEHFVCPGDSILFDQEVSDFGDGFLQAKAIDDRLGCAILLRLIQKPLPLDCYFVFTVQEEIGTRGAFGASFSIKPDLALVLESTTAADLPKTDGHKKVCIAGKGPVLPFMDGATIYDRGLFTMLRQLAVEHNIPWQTKHLIAGGTDAGAIQRSRDGVRVAGISAPVRYLHSAHSLVSLEDCAHMERLATLFLDAIAQD